MKILVTGFEPFDREKINPSNLVLDMLPKNILGFDIVTRTIPTAFNKSSEKLKLYINEFSPEIVVCLGQAGGRSKISVERIAINIDDARIPDNDGNQPIDECIQQDGENAYFSTLPIKAIVQNLLNKNIEAEISNSAGTFVCNHIMYNALHYAKKNNNNYKAGFIHIPYIPEQTINKINTPSMELEIIRDAIIIAIETAITFLNKDDLIITGGKEH